MEVSVGLSLMEMPPFGKGGSDIVWALPFFALIIFALAMPGLLAALSATRKPTRRGKFVIAGLVLNGVALHFRSCCSWWQRVASSFRPLA
jgi:hypothetical protein